MYPDNLRYTREHEWIRDDGGTCTVGITAYASEQLGDVTYVELPRPGAEAHAGDALAVVESVKAASDVYAPVRGRVLEVNKALEERPELVNESPYDEGWFFRLDDVSAAEMNGLMNADVYQAFLKGLEA
ncbi:MAG: glycine cleavage system protein GcvH [Candidatus Hydrogenedentes bacterium]|nr:glycine cleavage system protein GcvH [Candidatus Hydrogenedentota bacterium]